MAAATLDPASPLFDKLELFIDKRKCAAFALAAIGAGGLIAYPVARSPFPSSTASEMLAATVALAGSATLLAVGIVIIVRVLMHRGPALVIDAQGIRDRRTDAGLLPWTHIQDIRILDRHGRHIGIETSIGIERNSVRRRRWLPASVFPSYARHVTLIDTFFLQSVSGRHAFDVILPLSAMAPIEFSETPVSEETLSADARLSRRRSAAIVLFIVASVVIPAAAAIFIVS